MQIQQVNRKFRTAFALKPGFRFGALRKHCENIAFATDGFGTELNYIADQLNLAFQDFDPEMDCIVTVGTAIVNFLAGSLVAQKFPNQIITFAVFNRAENGQPEGYVFYDVPINEVFPQIPRKEAVNGTNNQWDPQSDTV